MERPSPQLKEVYVYADFETGYIWDEYAGDNVINNYTLAKTTLNISSQLPHFLSKLGYQRQKPHHIEL
ncbi:MAG: hypothetical protein ACQEP2_04285 [Actinomycetota bacterium]